MRALAVLALLSLPSFAEAPLAEAPVAESPEAKPVHLDAGFAGDRFFLRSSDDNFVLMPSGRLQIDFIAGQGGTPAATFIPRRARVETYGTLLKHFDYQLSAEITNAEGPPANDVLINIDYTRYANVQLGQYNAPFSMENRTSDKFLDLMERPSAVRAFGIPENKKTGAMVWGQPAQKWAYWSAGLFNGGGTNTYPNKDDRFDLLARGWVSPLRGCLSRAWIGGSFWTGYHSPSPAAQIDRVAMKDTAGFAFFNTRGIGEFGQVTKWGLELNAPIDQWVFKAELISGDEGLRELPTQRPTRLSGLAWYARASWFVFGDPLINGQGGMQLPPRIFGPLPPASLASALQLVAQLDHVGATYASRDGTAAPLAGDYNLDTLSFGANYWATRHVRATGNVLFNRFGGSSPTPLKDSRSNIEVLFRMAVEL
jgi:phosphate-selective porin